MKKYNFIKKYPFTIIGVTALIIFLLGPVIFSVLMAIIIILPLYLAVQIFGDND